MKVRVPAKLSTTVLGTGVCLVLLVQGAVANTGTEQLATSTSTAVAAAGDLTAAHASAGNTDESGFSLFRKANAQSDPAAARNPTAKNATKSEAHTESGSFTIIAWIVGTLLLSLLLLSRERDTEQSRQRSSEE